MQRFAIVAFCFLLAGSISMGMAASGSIGMVNARGSFQIDHGRVYGNATLFDGTVLETGIVAGEVRLTTGARMQLASDSRATVYRDRLVLERGAGKLQGMGYGIEAGNLRISAGEPNAGASVALRSGTKVLVAALHGRLQVTNARGVLVANLAAGTALEFETSGEGDSTSSHLVGVVRKQGNKFFLTDETTHVTVELRGPGLSGKAGKRVDVNGSVDAGAAPAEGAAQVVQVTSIVVASKAAAAAGASTAAGISAKTVAIIGGVAAAGTVAGLGITESLPGQGTESPSNSSR